MASKKITIEEILEDIVKFKEKGEFNYSKMSFDWMDMYVAKQKPETINDWVKKCLQVPKKENKNKVKLKDRNGVIKIFLEEYFPEFTEEAIAEKKAEAKKEKEKAKKEKEAIEKMTEEEKLIYRLKKMKEA